MKDSSFLYALVIIVLAALIIGVGPLLTIWSINALFGLGILYNLKTWFAAFFLTSVISTRLSKK